MDEKLKQLIGDEPRPKVKVHRMDRHEAKTIHKDKLGKNHLSRGFVPEGVKVSRLQQRGIRTQFTQEPVGNVDVYPYRCIGLCVAQNYQNGYSTVGVGTLLGPDFILTETDLINWVDGEWSMTFVPAYANGNAPFGVFNVTSAHGWKPDNSPVDSYLACQLDGSPGNTIGWFGYYSSTTGTDYQSYDYGQEYSTSTPYKAVGYPNRTVQIEADFTLSGTEARTGGSIDLENQPLFDQTGYWGGGPVWTEDINLNLDSSGTVASADGNPGSGESGGGEDAILCALIYGWGWQGSNTWQINEGGVDMTNLILWAQDQYV
jgi:hypothetical protein